MPKRSGRIRCSEAVDQNMMDKYERLHKIGEGAYGEVFKCVHKASGDAVAIKRFTDSDEDPSIRKMATRELGMLKVSRTDRPPPLWHSTSRDCALYVH